MRKVVPLLLASSFLAAGCTIMPDDYRDPYATRIDFGYYYGLPYYQQPFAYYHRCYGIYGPGGTCIYYRPPYVPVPRGGSQDDPVIPLTQPPVMAIGDSLAHVAPRRNVFPVQTRPANVPLRAQSRGEPVPTSRSSGAAQQNRSTRSRSTSSARPASRPTSRPSSRPAAPRGAPKPASRPRGPSSRPDP
jgi:hypothetical protein